MKLTGISTIVGGATADKTRTMPALALAALGEQATFDAPTTGGEE